MMVDFLNSDKDAIFFLEVTKLWNLVLYSLCLRLEKMWFSLKSNELVSFELVSTVPNI